MRLLLVEDEKELAGLVARNLTREGYTVDHVTTVEDARLANRVTPYDIVLLDLRLPDGSGITFLQELRNNKFSTPVIVVTARDGVEDRILGLNSGADDYLIKPFAHGELSARIQALLRRPRTTVETLFSVGNLEFDAATSEVCVNGNPITVPRRELAVLETLIRRGGRVVTRETIENNVYGFDEEFESNSLESHLSRLRKRLSAAGAQVSIHSIRGVGYLLQKEQAR